MDSREFTVDDLRGYWDLIVSKYSTEMFGRMMRSIFDKKWRSSDCGALNYFLLGYRGDNDIVGSSRILSDLIIPHPERLVAWKNEYGEIEGNPDLATTCIFGGLDAPGHFSLYLGSPNGRYMGFDQIPGESPRISVFEEDIIDESRGRYVRGNLPTYFYNIPFVSRI